MVIILISKYIFILFALVVFTMIIELLVIQAATVSHSKLQDVMDKDGMIPIPNLLVRYSVKEYYSKYRSMSNLFAKIINLAFILLTFKVLFFENIEQNIETGDYGIERIVFVSVLLLCILLCIWIIRILVILKMNGIENIKEKINDFEKCLVNQYVWIVKKVSKTDDERIANDRLWIQLFINKFFTIIIISVMFFVKTIMV
ncbi:MAG: hypothetical protein J6O09_03955 [Lachnospiraceae bacterium]|nr:hypothetical protein [Lachnospiraceae bacterium]